MAQRGRIHRQGDNQPGLSVGRTPNYLDVEVIRRTDHQIANAASVAPPAASEEGRDAAATDRT